MNIGRKYFNTSSRHENYDDSQALVKVAKEKAIKEWLDSERRLASQPMGVQASIYDSGGNYS